MAETRMANEGRGMSTRNRTDRLDGFRYQYCPGIRLGQGFFGFGKHTCLHGTDGLNDA